MPWVLTRGNGGAEIGYRVAGFISERWPASNRNGGRHRLGTGGRHASESAAKNGLDTPFDMYQKVSPEVGCTKAVTYNHL